MTIPSNIQGAVSVTPGGIVYVTLHDSYSEQWTANGCQVGCDVVIDWETRDEFIAAVIGYSAWDGISPNLNRTLPLECPLSEGLWCDSAVLISTGMISDSGTPLADADNGNWPNFDWARYRLTFVRPPWFVLSDSTLASISGNLEQFRFVQLTTRYVPRERKNPAYIVQFDQGPVQSPPTTGNWMPSSEVGFLPDYQIEYVLIWKAVPYGAIPWTAINAALLTVNLTAFSPSTQNFIVVPGGLLFKGIQNPISWYADVNGDFVVDLAYVFSYQPGGWNNFRVPALTADTPPQRQYVPMRIVPAALPSGAPDTPPFPSTEFQLLFTPAAS